MMIVSIKQCWPWPYFGYLLYFQKLLFWNCPLVFGKELSSLFCSNPLDINAKVDVYNNIGCEDVFALGQGHKKEEKRRHDWKKKFVSTKLCI